MNAPQVSVVMGVYNGGAELQETLDSVLGQERCDLELIVVDDGSTDGTPDLLHGWAADHPRLRVIRSGNNEGLTQALARGCSAARGEFIARQDCGDVSLPGRLARQVGVLRAHPAAVMTACAVRTLGPEREVLFVTASEGARLHEGLDPGRGRQVIGPPHHGGTLFRRSAYEAAGGYRPFFAVAQDIDLWLRLREQGACLGDAAVGYEARLAPGSISASRRAEQLRYAAIAQQCARLRERGQGDHTLLQRPPLTPARGRAPDARRARAGFLYFVGSCLASTDPDAARRYYRRALREDPLHLRSLARLFFR
jgi:glycosyltransferase involved in cell wall biosynthesis